VCVSACVGGVCMCVWCVYVYDCVCVSVAFVCGCMSVWFMCGVCVGGCFSYV